MEHSGGMLSRPCLIFHAYRLKVTDGGPSGFVAQNLAGHSSENYKVSKAHQIGGPRNKVLSLLHREYRAKQLKKALKKVGLPPKNNPWRSHLEFARRSFEKESAKNYAWIWFHDVVTLCACLDMLDARQKVILQPHCPETPSDEALHIGGSVEDANWMKRVERAAFERANVCVLPNENVLPIYASLIQPATKIKYLLSGCMQMKAKSTVPLDPKFIYHLYLGRRMAIKGYDLVLQAFQKAYEQDPSLRLIVVGGGETSSAPGVIDIGFSEQPAQWFASCDYLISANRQSYFDLSVMEALSLGTPLIINCSGGHHYFKDIRSEGVFSLSDAGPETLAQAFLVNRKKRSANEAGCAANQKLFQEEFESAKYRNRLDRLLAGILEEQSAGTN
jgi:glycosyltransferase involved in cell wall biosynthesis